MESDSNNDTDTESDSDSDSSIGGPGVAETDTGNFSSALANLLNMVSKCGRKTDTEQADTDTEDTAEDDADVAGSSGSTGITIVPASGTKNDDEVEIAGTSQKTRTESEKSSESEESPESSSSDDSDDDSDWDSDTPIFTPMNLEEMLKNAKQRVNLKSLYKPGEYEAQCKYEKKVVKRLENKCTLLLELGLPLPPEDILREKLGLDPKHPPKFDSSDSESDDDAWNPSGKSKRRRMPIFRGISTEAMAERLKFIEKYVEDRQNGLIPDTSLTTKDIVSQPIKEINWEERKPKFVPFKEPETREDKENEAPRYNTRRKSDVKYAEHHTPEDDDFIYCDECEKTYEDDCPKHPAMRMKDCVVKMGGIKRAKRTCPPGLSVDPSQIRNGGDGVWCDSAIPKNTVFGPYEGEIVKKYDVKKLQRVADGGYSWEIYKKGKLSHYIDGSDATKSNWLRYVNCARYEEEQNLIAFQYKGKIYYRTFKDIKANVELFVWYGSQYAKQIGIACDAKTIPTLPKAPAKVKRLVCGNSSINTADDKTGSTVACAEKDNSAQEDVLTETPDSAATTGDCDSSSFQKQNVAGSKVSQKKRKAQCPKCMKYFSCAYKMKLHVRTVHEGIRDYECERCGKAFTDAGALKRHMLTHTGEKPYKCDVCGDRFNRSSNMKSHKRIHSGEKPYKCDICGVQFALLHHLKDHKRIHSGEKPYKCDACGDRFTQLNTLKRHKRIHSGEKPYQCSCCGQRFAHCSSMKYHLKRMHNSS